uniref:Uncharacterized protein n=2 Tax=Brassica oleracea TaxID=3712 RepID=A0A0D3AN21_BRAOL|nr:unnamed protein product [Brassica oleracea]
MVAHTFAFDFHLGVVPKAESLDADPAYMEMPHPKVACSQAPKKPKEQNPKTLTLAGEPTNPNPIAPLVLASVPARVPVSASDDLSLISVSARIPDSSRSRSDVRKPIAIGAQAYRSRSRRSRRTRSARV